MHRLITLLFLCVSTIGSSFSQEKILFKIAPQKDVSQSLKMMMNMNMEGPQTMSMMMDMNFKMTPTVITEEHVVFETKYEHIKTDVDAGLIILSYDSDKEPTNEFEKTMSSQIKPMLEGKTSIKTNRFGKVLDIDMPNTSGPALNKSTLQSFNASFPAHPITFGDTWESDAVVADANMKIVAKNKLVEKTNGGYKITVDGVYKDLEENQIGTISGHYVVDDKTFGTKSSVIEIELKYMGSKIKTSINISEKI